MFVVSVCVCVCVCVCLSVALCQCRISLKAWTMTELMLIRTSAVMILILWQTSTICIAANISILVNIDINTIPTCELKLQFCGLHANDKIKSDCGWRGWQRWPYSMENASQSRQVSAICCVCRRGKEESNLVYKWNVAATCDKRHLM